MSEPKFLYKEAIAHGWKMTKKYLGTIFGFALIYILILGTGEILKHFAKQGAISIGLTLIFWIFSFLLTMGFIKVFLKISRDQKPSLDDFLSNWNILIPVLCAGFCYYLMILGGLLLLIIPGLIFIITFSLYQYLIIDKGLGPIEALKRSRVITKGSRMRLAILAGILMLLNIAGIFCLFVGLFFTMSIGAAAMAHVYDRLENATDVNG